jgi:predicted phosphodiesterase
MKLLLVSDTHGHLEQINTLAAEVGAQAVIHAGDFGFYDSGSIDRLESRELFLHVVHSDLPAEQKNQAKKMRSDKMRQWMHEHMPLSDLAAWIEEERGFQVPVYAVWGNHEDRVVIESIMTGRLRIPNLNLVYEEHCHYLAPFRFFGLGGNILPNSLGDQSTPLAGEKGKIWTTLVQIGKLAEAMEAPKVEGEIRVLISHVSPGKEPLLVHLAARLGVDITISGHMGSPWTVVWDEFAVRSPEESNQRLAKGQERLATLLRSPSPQDTQLRQWTDKAKTILETLPLPLVEQRGTWLPRWYRGGFHINLPDIPDGYAMMTAIDGRMELQTMSRGLRLHR